MAERRTVLRRAAGTVTATLVGMLWTAGLHGADVGVADWYLPLLCAAGSVLIALRPGPIGRTVPTRMEHGATADPRAQAVALRELEAQVGRALNGAGAYDARLAPLLRELARERAGYLGRIDELPTLIGEDAWPWLTTDTQRRRPPSGTELSVLVERVEHLYRLP